MATSDFLGAGGYTRPSLKRKPPASYKGSMVWSAGKAARRAWIGVPLTGWRQAGAKSASGRNTKARAGRGGWRAAAC